MRLSVLSSVAAVAMAAASANAVVLYDANTTTGGIGGFVGENRAIQEIALNGPDQAYTINSFTVMGVRYQTLPSTSPYLQVKFYTAIDEAAAADVDVTTLSTLVGSAVYSLPTTGVTANTSYNFTLPSVNINVPTNDLFVEVGFYTDNTLSTLVDNLTGTVGRFSTGVPSVGLAAPYSYLDNDGDGKIESDEAFVAQTSPQVALNIRMAIDATPVPEPVCLGAMALAIPFVTRRRKA